MTDFVKKKCLTAYYNTDIEPTLDRLNQVKDIVILKSATIIQYTIKGRFMSR